jgi:hypothetical protein
VYHGRLARVLLFFFFEEPKTKETVTAKMAVVHTGKMPVPRETATAKMAVVHTGRMPVLRETATAKMAVVHTGKMPVPRETAFFNGRLNPPGSVR